MCVCVCVCVCLCVCVCVCLCVCVCVCVCAVMITEQLLTFKIQLPNLVVLSTQSMSRPANKQCE